MNNKKWTRVVAVLIALLLVASMVFGFIYQVVVSGF